MTPRNPVEQLSLEIDSFVGLMKTNGLTEADVTQFHGIVLRASELRANEVYQQALTDGTALTLELMDRNLLDVKKKRETPAHIMVMVEEISSRSSLLN